MGDRANMAGLRERAMDLAYKTAAELAMLYRAEKLSPVEATSDITAMRLSLF